MKKRPLRVKQLKLEGNFRLEDCGITYYLIKVRPPKA
jgi:hypothetical protein